MNMTDPVADMVARIRNGVRAKLPKVDVPSSKLKVEIARILIEDG
jgi:small subunit ribosomal protein S8